jgi:lipopolysaccharide export system protein LptA
VAPESESAPIGDAAVTSTGLTPPPMTMDMPSSEVVPAVAPPEPVTEPIAESPGGSNEAAAAGKKRRKGEKVASNSPENNSPFAGFSNSKSPVDITSDTMSLDYKGQSVLFNGHVKVNQADGKLTSDALRVNYADAQFKTIRDMIADGNVRISQGTRWATGSHAVMDQNRRTVVLTGSPIVHDGPDQITGKRITVYLDSGKSLVEGARAVIYPRQDQGGSGTQSASPKGK